MEKNATIRKAAKDHRVFLWQIAEELGISEFTLCRKLRKELPEAEQEKILSLIRELAKEEE